jgi:hypothetical protein
MIIANTLIGSLYKKGINLSKIPSNIKSTTPTPTIAHGTQVGNRPSNQFRENILHLW